MEKENIIRKTRKAQGLTLKELSEMSGMSIRAIQKYESGEYEIGNMTLHYALRLCDALKIEPHMLIED